MENEVGMTDEISHVADNNLKTVGDVFSTAGFGLNKSVMKVMENFRGYVGAGLVISFSCKCWTFGGLAWLIGLFIAM